METIIRQLIADSMELEIPPLTRRRGKLAELANSASVLVGMRRTGKTYRMFQKMQELLDAGIARTRMLYLNFEDERLADMTLETLRIVDEAYLRAFPPNSHDVSYYFFDEIQYVPGWERFVRRILDRDDVRFFLSGSSSRLLSREVATAMRGRAVETRVFPFSFAEYLDARAISLPDKMSMIGRKKRAVYENAFAEYLQIGGFPATLSLSDLDRRQVLQGYVNTVVLRDVVERHGVTGIAVLRYLTRHLLASSASHFSVNKFYNDLKSQGLKCSKDTLHDNLQHLEDAFLFSSTFLDTPSERRRMVNPRKMYTADHGLVWACLPPGVGWGEGRALENLVFTELQRRGSQPRYGITSEGHEIDFVAQFSDGQCEAIQVCAEAGAPQTRARELRSLLATTTDARKLVLTLYEEETIREGEQVIEMIPTWKWLLAGRDSG
jgi:predicted AAA+ superfamily ATPase